MRSSRAMISIGLAAGLMCTASISAVAQSAQPFSIQASFIHASLGGDAFEGIEAGGGMELQGRWNPSAFSIGLGFQSTSHDFTDATFPTDNSLDITGGFFEPRYVIALNSERFAPYVALRLSSVKVTGEDLTDPSSPGDTFTLTSDGTGINVGGGLLVRLSSRVNMDVGATFGHMNFKDATLRDDATGQTAPLTISDGSDVVLRLGVAVGLGK